MNESIKYQKMAQQLLQEVNKLLEEAQKAVDSSEKYNLYKQAMDKSNKAYSLMAKAAKINKKNARQKNCDSEKTLY